MTLKELSAKLRKVADSLDELVGINLDKPTKNETNKTAKKIIKKLHWTQTREGKKRITKHLKRISKLR